jgi:hypothetical protein
MNWETDYNLRREEFIKSSVQNLSKDKLNEFYLLSRKFLAIKRKIYLFKNDLVDLEKKRIALRKSKKRFNYFAIALMLILLVISFFKDQSNAESWLTIILAAMVYAWNAFSFHEEDKMLFQLYQAKDQTIELISMPLLELGLLYVAADEERAIQLSESYTPFSQLSEADQLLYSSYFTALDLSLLKIIGVDVPISFSDSFPNVN